MVDKCGQPELGYPPDDARSLLKMRFPELIVLLFNFENLLTSLLVHGVYVILASVDLLESLLCLVIELFLFYRVIQLRLFTHYGRVSASVLSHVWKYKDCSVRKYSS